MDIWSGQKLVWENKVAKEFNATNVPLEFCAANAPVTPGRVT